MGDVGGGRVGGDSPGRSEYHAAAIANVDDYSGSARLLAATTLRNVLGTKNLGDILSERESIANEMQDLLLEATEPWGVTVERVEVQKFHLFLNFFNLNI